MELIGQYFADLGSRPPQVPPSSNNGGAAASLPKLQGNSPGETSNCGVQLYRLPITHLSISLPGSVVLSPQRLAEMLVRSVIPPFDLPPRGKDQLRTFALGMGTLASPPNSSLELIVRQFNTLQASLCADAESEGSSQLDVGQIVREFLSENTEGRARICSMVRLIKSGMQAGLAVSIATDSSRSFFRQLLAGAGSEILGIIEQAQLVCSGEIPSDSADRDFWHYLSQGVRPKQAAGFTFLPSEARGMLEVEGFGVVVLIAPECRFLEGGFAESVADLQKGYPQQLVVVRSIDEVLNGLPSHNAAS